MKTLFDNTTVNEMINRIENLNPSTQRQWGKMDVGQMLAHCTACLDMANGTKQYPRLFIGRLLGGFFKKKVLTDIPMDKNSPTQKEFIYTDPMDFEVEKQKLISGIKNFEKMGRKEVKDHVHPFFGMLTTEEWGISAVKHLEHHLKQFGV